MSVIIPDFLLVSNPQKNIQSRAILLETLRQHILGENDEEMFVLLGGMPSDLLTLAKDKGCNIASENMHLLFPNLVIFPVWPMTTKEHMDEVFAHPVWSRRDVMVNVYVNLPDIAVQRDGGVVLLVGDHNRREVYTLPEFPTLSDSVVFPMATVIKK